VDGSVGVVVTISKFYEDRNFYPYWYSYHPDWDAFLAEREAGYFLLGCMDREEAYAIPRTVLAPLLPTLNATVRGDNGKLHWHIHVVERGGELAVLLPKTDSTLPLRPYTLLPHTT